MRSKAKLAAAGAAVISLVAVAGAAGAQTSLVNVSLANTSPTRTLYVENLAGQDLSQSGLNLGSLRSAPFRVRVVDQTMTPQNFSVSATMTNLYQCSGSGSSCTPVQSQSIDSSNVSLSYGTNPLDVLNVSATVAPLFNFSEDVSTVDSSLCTTLQTLSGNPGACTISLTSLQGLPQTLNQAVSGLTASALSGLPLVPQSGSAGAFASPDWQGVASAFKPSNPAAPTQLPVLTGGSNLTSGVLTTLQNALATSPTNSIVDVNSVLVPALSNALGTAVASATNANAGGPVWALLTTAQQNELVANLTPALVPILAAQVTGLSGTYMSFPTLNVSVPNTAAGGTYEGTLVVTGF
ncbi:MAG TPA: hypothetical protein VFA11_10255 [Acidimicrobiales bacterium]|nr:hypothetical protein [Acidimicrobiales bacterium]